MRKKFIAALLWIALGASATAGDGWWMWEPIRWIQTNLRETDSGLDPQQLVDFLANYRANVLLLNMGGIVAQYPTKLEFHYASPHMPPGGDTFGEVLRLAQQRRIRVVGRFDFSKTQKPVFDAHPEWFFRRANGEPVIYNGLYSTCINGGYYRQHAMNILTEALERYEVDGLFFNMFGNQSTDYSGRFVGHCHCEACQHRFRERYGRDLPAQPDTQYREFLAECSREVAAAIGKLIHEKRPQAGYFNYMQELTDGIMSESNTAVSRPLPLWPYSASDNVNRARTSQPGKVAVNLNMQFVDYPWRFATVPKQEIALRMWQNLAHGGALTLAINGTPANQQDRQALEIGRPIFRWAAEHQQFYIAQKSAARVLLLRSTANQASYRGIFRLLTEQHVPFSVADNMEWLARDSYDLVIAADWAPRALESWLRNGGRLLIVSGRQPEFAPARVVKRWESVQGYMRVRDRAVLPSLTNADLLMLNGDYLELEASGRPALTFVPPSMFGPPEKIHVDMQDTDKPGLVFGGYGQGRFAWLPWDVGGLYYRHSLDSHAALLADVIERMLPNGRQVTTNAHPAVEFSLMQQGSRTLLHMVNVSGHSGTAYFPPAPMQGIRVAVAGRFSKAASQRDARNLPVRHGAGYTEFTLPRLLDYELVVLQ